MIRVLIAEDMQLLRGALVSLLDLEPDIDVVAAVSSGAEIVERAMEVRPDVALLDIGLPDLDGISAARQLRDRLPECGVLIVSGMVSSAQVSRALEAGVAGLLLKDAEPQRLVAAIREVATGGVSLDLQLILAAHTQPTPTQPMPTQAVLSPRELEVLGLAAEGHDAPEIATRLFLSAGTVRNYLTASVGKLKARNRLDAIRIARGAGWL